MKASRSDLMALALGEVTVETFAKANGLSTSEAETLRATFVEGLKAGSGHPPRTTRLARWALLTALVATGAFAQLVVFQPDTPALASDVNGNFAQLKTWLETKVGVVTNAGITATTVNATGITTTTLNATTATVSGTLSATAYLPAYGNWNSLSTYGAGGAGIVNDNGAYQTLMLVGNTSSGSGGRQVKVFDDLTVGNRLFIQGSGGNTLHNCKVRSANGYVASCAGGEVAISGGGNCPWTGDSYTFASSVPWSGGSAAGDNTMPTGWRTDCLVWGGANNHLAPTPAYAVCCQQ